MNRLIGVFLSLFLLSNGFSQENFGGLSFGLSIPLEDFASTSLLENGGYAVPGLLLSFDGSYMLGNNIGINGGLTFGSNAVNSDALKKNLIENLPDDIPDSIDVLFNVGQWLYVNIMVGPFFTIPAGNFNFDARLIGGLSVMMVPPTDLTVETGEGVYTLSRASQGVSFGFSAGLGIRYHLSEAYSVRVYTDYFYSRPTIGQNIRDDIPSTGLELEDTEFTINASTINVGIGVAYRF